MTERNRKTNAAFTLVELLVVMAIIGLLVALLLPAIQSARQAARRTQCINNMRQLGIGFLNYADTHGGKFPEVSDHRDAHGHTVAEEEAWIYTLGPFIEEVDSIRICPDDPRRDARMEGKRTSYVMNGYLAVLRNISIGSTNLKNIYGTVKNINKVRATSKTIVMFEAASSSPDNPGQQDADPDPDHVHSYDWFNSNDPGEIFQSVSSEVAVNRHHGTSANYLYLDAHVASISSEQINDWCDQLFNFAKPQK